MLNNYYGDYYDNACEIFGEESAFNRYSSNKGKLLIASADEDNTTRLFIKTGFNDAQRKNGWWNTFTITNTADIKSGLYICHIDDVKKDKYGYPIYVVTPIMDIDWNILTLEYYYTINLFYNSAMFIYDSGRGLGHTCNVIDYIAEEIDHDFDKRRSYNELCKSIVEIFMDNKISISKINELLRAPTKYEKELAELKERIANIYRNAEDLKANESVGGPFTWSNVLICAVKHKENKPGFSSYDFVRYIMEIIDSKYDRAVIEGKIKELPDDVDPLDKAEVYLEFDYARKAANKAKKNAAKKAKKSSK